MSKRVLMPNTGRGKELQQLLRAELGIPEHTKWFEVRFAVDEIVTVRCEYLPEAATQPAVVALWNDGKPLQQ